MFRVFLLTIGVVLSVVMVLKVGVTGFAERLIAAPPYWILLSIALYGLILLLGIFRWTVYLKMLGEEISICLLYTSPSPRDGLLSRMPSSA